MAKKPTASQLARKAKQKQKQQQKKLLQSVERREQKAVFKNNRREALAAKWHSTAAHEIGHAVIQALLGLPLKNVNCSEYSDKDRLVLGSVRTAHERKAFVTASSALPPSAAFLIKFAGKAAVLAAGFSAYEAEEGMGSDREQAERTYSQCLAVTNSQSLTDLSRFIPKHIDTTRKPHKQLFAYVCERSVAVGKAILEQERVAFTQLVDELRYSQKVKPPHTGAPSGYLKGTRIAEVLFEKGTNVNGARDTLIAEAIAIDEYIGTKLFLVENMPETKKGLSGIPAVLIAQISILKRDEINLAARLRRAKKKR